MSFGGGVCATCCSIKCLTLSSPFLNLEKQCNNSIVDQNGLLTHTARSSLDRLFHDVEGFYPKNKILFADDYNRLIYQS